MTKLELGQHVKVQLNPTCLMNARYFSSLEDYVWTLYGDPSKEESFHFDDEHMMEGIIISINPELGRHKYKIAFMSYPLPKVPDIEFIDMNKGAVRINTKELYYGVYAANELVCR